MVRFSLLAGAALLAAGCQMKSGAAGHPPVNEAEAARIAEAAEASFTTGDINRVMAQYADKAVMIDASAPDPSADRKVQVGWARTFVSMQPADYKVVDRHIQLV